MDSDTWIPMRHAMAGLARHATQQTQTIDPETIVRWAEAALGMNSGRGLVWVQSRVGDEIYSLTGGFDDA